MNPPPDESLVTLSFHEIWRKFQQRKRDYLKRFGRRPTGVIVGQVEKEVLSKNMSTLLRRKLVRVDRREHPPLLRINNMVVITGAQETCIAPFHFEVAKLRENPYASPDAGRKI